MSFIMLSIKIEKQMKWNKKNINEMSVIDVIKCPSILPFVYFWHLAFSFNLLSLVYNNLIFFLNSYFKYYLMKEEEKRYNTSSSVDDT